MDDATRGRLQRMTQAARRLLEREYSEQLEGTLDVRLDGRIPPEPGGSPDAAQLLLREKVITAVEHRRAAGMAPDEAVADYVREAAFTTLNRFVALRLLEARGLVQQCVSRGDRSGGFREFCGLAPGLIDLPDAGYRIYLESLFDELGREVRVLFDRRDVGSLLWPRRPALAELLGLLAEPELEPVWREDETIGWVYQYFNGEEERKQMRAESPAPRNSRELAVRNQFFTPRYVVEFLTDNTLGRLWYEMRRGRTGLAETCEFLVRRPDEVFLGEGEEVPEAPEDGEGPVYVPFRAAKDPREIRVLDPACGSGHFLLYAFDLLVTVYEEAWADPELGPPLWEAVGAGEGGGDDLGPLRRALPAWILRHNLYGVDIDPRAAQIAAFALWLRAQRAYDDLGVAAVERAPVTRTNVVVAEPMPGDEALQREFVESLRPRALGQFVEVVFRGMRLAGEAGTLLRIEEELREALATARRQWEVREPREQLALIPGLARPQPRQEGLFDVANVPDEAFWEEVEERVVGAVRRYAERAEEARDLRRTLFAGDAAQGFAFVETCRRRYDVVVMNPPFGEGTADAKEYVDRTFPSSRQDLFAAFVERAVGDLVPEGFVGVLSTEAGFFRRTLEAWRREVVLARCTVGALAHLGGHVLDGATVRTACYSLRTPHRHATSVFLRVLRADDREAGLRQAVRQVNAAERSNAVYATSQAGFTSLPWAVFGYWCSEAVRGAFSTMPTMEPAGAVVRQGLATSDDGRFLRLRWEVRNASVGRGRAWLPFAKGGVFSPFHDDVHLALRWQADGYELKQLSVQRYGSATKRVCSEDWYFRPGLTYPLRTNKRFAPRALPSGCAFGHKGPAVVDVTGSRTALLALLSSRPASYLLGLALGTAEAEGGAGANSYEVGLVQRLPCPPEATTDEDLTTFGDRSWQLRAEPDVRAETTARFVSPLAPVSPQGCLAATLHALLALRRDHEAEYERLQHAIDDRVRVLYRLTDSDWDEIQREVGPVHSVPVPDDDDPKALEAFATAYVQFAVGCAFGRWDPAQAHVTDTSSALADPFEPVRAHADADPSADAVLVDDSGHPADLARRVQAVFETHWGDAAPDVAQEAAAALSARGGELRAWLRRGFFAEHIKRYSKSRRKAPVYWQLATPSAGYSAWLYYPRAGGDTLFRVLTELVGPKLAHEERHLDALRGDLAAGPTVRLRKQVAGQETLVEELAAFSAELARVAPLWDPHPDDGVIVNFAPLWRLVPQHRSWQQACRKTWDALVRGDYDWSHLAMRLWPERVVPKCAGDRSLAIAHGLEGVFWTEDAAGKWQPRAVAESEVERLVRERSSASVQAAVEELLTTSTAEPAPRRGKER